MLVIKSRDGKVSKPEELGSLSTAFTEQQEKVLDDDIKSMKKRLYGLTAF